MSKIPIKIQNKAVIQIGPDDNYINITLHRTLRIPDDGKVYALPPSMGIFPIHKVDDYKNKVPKEWLKTGGVFFPMYQREAMWMQFSLYNKFGTKPKALKIGVGKVNAVSGKPWKNELDKKENDYVICPEQKWLDGINSGDGFIKQFIAMPLGSGYTVEGQVTGEEKFGGIQIICYDSKQVKKQEVKYVQPQPQPQPYQQPYQYNMYQQNYGYPYQQPQYQQQYQYQQQQQWNYAPQQPVSGQNFHQNYYSPPATLGSNSSVRSGRFGGGGKGRGGYRPAPVKRGFAKKKCKSKKKSYSNSRFVEKSKFQRNRKRDDRRELKEDKGIVKDSNAQEMGLGAGGKMKQKVVKDKYGYNSWDHTKYGRIYIRIVNSTMYEQITGEKTPDCPISAKSYTSYGYPWFDLYEEKVQDIKKSKILSKVKTVKEIDKDKHVWPKKNVDSTVKITNVKTIQNDSVSIPPPVENVVVKDDVVKIPQPVVVVVKKDEDSSKDDETNKKLVLLEKMGFGEKKLNEHLLKQNNGNIQKVIALLVEYNSMK